MPRALLATLVVAALAVCGLSACGGSSQPPAAAASGDASGAPYARAVAAARAFLARYEGPDGRVRRLDQGGDTVSEGQAYAMLIAAGIGDWGRFDAAWRWTRRNLRRPDGLLSSHWAAGHVVDPQPATDADLDAARALLVASCRRDRPDLRRDALAIGRSVLREETARRGGRLVLAAGPWATGQPVTVDPSYLDPSTLRALAAAGDGGGLAAAARDGVALIAQVSRPLPPDWATVDGAGRVRTSGPPGKVVPATFGFDAARTLVRLAEDSDPAGRRLAAAAWPVFRGQAPDAIVVEHTLTGAPAGSTHHPVVLVAAAGAATAAGDRGAAARLLDAADALQSRSPTYYGGAWTALGRLLLTTDRLRACAG